MYSLEFIAKMFNPELRHLNNNQIEITVVNNEGKNMEQISNINTDLAKPALTDEELDALLAQGAVVSVDDADETDEEKVLN